VIVRKLLAVPLAGEAGLIRPKKLSGGRGQSDRGAAALSSRRGTPLWCWARPPSRLTQLRLVALSPPLRPPAFPVFRGRDIPALLGNSPYSGPYSW